MKLNVRGKVIYGDGYGAPLGYPTANLRMPKKTISSGVYAGYVKFSGKRYKGLVVVGMPSETEKKPKLEVHILDFEKMIYGQWLSVEIVKKMRPLKEFSHRNLLLETIKNDCEQARLILDL
ncbi:MAG: riboflavin kinase [Patescibacteria group bacterium]|jgi:riboflavin kinase/FMN adenylyltransferase